MTKVEIVGEEALKIDYIQHMGSDEMVLRAAKVSVGKDKIEMDKDKHLISYLAKNLHTSPFEHIVVTFRVECPLYIRSQWHRHRTQAYNEWSGRYSVVGEEFYLPKAFKHQSKKNKQGQGESFTERECQEMLNMNKIGIDDVKTVYDYLIDNDVSKEQARGILPQCMITKFYATASLLNWMRYLSQRVDAHAQYEHRILATRIFHELIKMFPLSVGSLARSMFNEQTQVDIGLMAIADMTIAKVSKRKLGKIQDLLKDKETLNAIMDILEIK